MRRRPRFAPVDMEHELKAIVVARALAVLLTAVLLAGCGSSIPETPDNAFIDAMLAAQLGETGRLEGRLCEEIRTDPEAVEAIESVGREQSVSLDGDVAMDGNTASVPFEAVIPRVGSEPAEKNGLAHMRLEGGVWKLCGLS